MANKFGIMLFGFVLISLIGFVSAQVQVGQTNDDFYGGSRGTASYVKYGSSFNSYYGSELSTYWPTLSNIDECNARQDILVQVSPIGCQPAVVRSDLLAEQNVPVFCQLDLLQINPAIDIKQIRSMSFNGKYPPYVASVGFHPARAALRTGNNLLGSPLKNNIGYVVVVLKKNPNEKEIPDFFNFTLSASIDYYSGNALGIGATELLLEETSEAEWQTNKYSQSFLRGQYSVRLLDSDVNGVKIGLYKEDIKTSEVSLSRDKQQSNPVYLPNSYCQTGLRFSYSDFTSSGKLVKVQVDDDILDLYEGARFLNGQCIVKKVSGNYLDVTAEVSCGRELLKLTIRANTLSPGTEVYRINEENEENKDKKHKIVSVENKDGKLTYSVLPVEETDVKKAIYVTSSQIIPTNPKALSDENYRGDESDDKFAKAIGHYENLADLYGFEQKVDHKSSKYYGEIALQEAIDLADKNGKKLTAARLIDKYLKQYPDGDRVRDYKQTLSRYYTTDSSLSGGTIELSDGFHLVKILEIKSPTKLSSARLVWGNKEWNLDLGTSVQTELGTITLTSVRDQDNLELNVLCKDNSNNDNKRDDATNSNAKVISLNVRDNKIVCANNMRIVTINQEKSVLLRIATETKTSTTSNFTVGIGIDKRLFELTPDKAQKKIENLNKTIKTWESISNNLGNVVKGLKGACFATAGILTVKNFFTGLSGEALARREAMQGDNGWTKICQDEVSRGVKGSESLTACYNKYSDKIASDVSARTLAIKETNDVTSQIEKNNKHQNKEGIFAGDRFDDLAARQDLLNKIKEECPPNTLAPTNGNENRKVSDLLPSQINQESAKQYSYSQLRDVYFNCKVIKNGGSAEGVRKAQTDLGLIGNSIEQRKSYEKDVALYKRVEIYTLDERNRGTYSGETAKSVADKGFTNIPSGLKPDTPVQVVRGRDKSYLITLEKKSRGYQRQDIYSLEGTIVGQKVDIPTSSGVGGVQTDLSGLPSTFDLTTSGSYYNSFAQGEITLRYFETEPYKGMPAIVPFDLNNGFYAATTQSLPLLGQTKSFEANGRPSSFFVCNIMKDGRIGFYAPNYGDDECVQFNMYTGQPYTNFPGLTEQETKKLVSDAIQSLEEAAQQYGKKTVRIKGNNINVGQAASLIPGTQCQDFMSPEDCKLLFNVCDPVICPATRCDFGGTYRVADVIQSGIVGSALLCLPNYKDGIVMPVCLTGLKAGIDGYLSMLKSHQQCLQEAIDTGKYVGICDQINSVYLCEFFWRQAAPLASAVIPKVVEYAYNRGQGSVRGGGEYLTVQNSYQNAEDSVKYFTQSYAVNSIEAFNVRSVAEAGTPFCKAFVSAKGPKGFESLIEPDSPSQFHAWFSAIDYSDATVPATSQYKVFYHIFAGNDRGVSYSVYLKDPPAGAKYSANPIIVVATGFAAKGQYATESKDFTAPKGYKQLCVRINDNEECGFKQVSSSFAINYVRDKVVSDELTRTDITTESQCISGSVSPLAIFNPNIQEAAQEAIDPALYNRGVVRVCATDNPGRGTDPTRFVEVGYCGESRLKCWLDKKSVDRAITDSNIGVRNKTLSQLEQSQKDILTQTDVLRTDEFISKLRLITEKIVPGLTKDKLDPIIAELDSLEKNTVVVFNRDRASIIYWKARAYAEVFKTIDVKIPDKDQLASADSSSASSADSSSASSNVPNRFLQLRESVEPSLNREYKYVFILGGKATKILISRGERIRFIESNNEIDLGILKDDLIILSPTARTKIESVFGAGSFDIIKQKNSLKDLKKGYDLRSYAEYKNMGWKNDATVEINFIENDAYLSPGTRSEIW
jgi:hypothetical protein